MKGSVQVQSIFAGSLEGNPLGDPSTRLTPIYLPPGYADGSERYPVVYLLHGFTSSGVAWLNSSAFARNVPERMDDLISSGAIPPCIGVFPDGWTALGGGQWINSDGHGRYRDYVAKDLVNFVDRTYRTVAKPGARALVGKSSGGYGAWVISRFHPEIFSHIGVHSGDAAFEYCYLGGLPQALGPIIKAGGIEAWFKDFKQRASATKMRGDDHGVINMLAMSAAYTPKKGEPLGLEFPIALDNGHLRVDVWNRWLVHDPVRFIPRHLDLYKKLKSIFVDCGTRDEFNMRWGARMAVDELKKGGVPHRHEEFEDGHMGINYRFDSSLSYLAPRLERS